MKGRGPARKRKPAQTTCSRCGRQLIAERIESFIVDGTFCSTKCAEAAEKEAQP